MRSIAWTRREFCTAAAAAASLPLMPRPVRAATMPEDERTAWYRAAKFGMFVHWGPYSLASVEASWPIMEPGKWGISEAEYRALPQRFNPSRFDPNHFIDVARTAGQQYMVFTTKHHDGFCMFDTSYTDYKITKTPYGKDIVKQLADACATRAMPLGFYYSPPDLHHPGFRDTTKLARENWNGQPERPEWSSYLAYMQLQLTELLTRYGDVTLIWFDGLNHQEKYEGQHFLDLIRQLQPGTLVNDRIGLTADYVTPEQFIPKAIPTRDVQMRGADASVQGELRPGVPTAAEFQLWETCMTINETWAYNAHDRQFKSAAELIRGLVEVTSRGGNFLLNVGPGPDGVIQPEFTERLRAVGDWLAVNGDAIYGTTFGPVQGQAGFRTTAKRDAVFVHVMEKPTGPLRVPDLKAKVLAARLLETNEPVVFTQDERGVQLTVPPGASKAAVNVVALRML